MPRSDRPRFSRILGLWRAWSVRYRSFAAPQANGLPTRRVFLAFPALLLIFGTIAVGFAISGTSSGAMYSKVYEGHDPALLAGNPQMIRSDEWYVNTSWAISQVQQGLPERNETVPGGMDAALPHDLPRADWSVIFRPHLWGYLVFDVGHATAFKWWIPALSFIAAAYCFLVTLIPRRPLLAAGIAIGFFFSPFFQWWFLIALFWPMTWALVTMTAVLWAARDISRPSRWVWAAAVAFFTVVMAMGIYAPFIVPVVLVVALFAVGVVIEEKRKGLSWRTLAIRGTLILLAGAVGALVTAGWLVSKQATINGFLSTAYPGQRFTPPGSGGLATGLRTIGSSFSEALRYGGGFLNINSSEASTFFLIGAFLIPVVAWVAYRAVRARTVLPWTSFGLVASILLFTAFSYLPGWDSIAHLLFLDRTSDGRLRIGLGLASFAILGYVIRSLDESRARVGLVLSSATAALFLVSQAIVALTLVIGGQADMLRYAPRWWVFALVSAASIFLFARRRPVLGGIAFALVTFLSTATVNPVYVGVFDLRGTPVAKAVMRLDHRYPGAWVGIGDVEVSGVLLQSGAVAFSGVQGAPSRTMWREVDPSSKYRFNWNRLAGIGWIPGNGEPVITNPAPDQIVATFDACSTFAQSNVSYVLAKGTKLSSPCLVRVQSFSAPKAPFVIYRIIRSD